MIGFSWFLLFALMVVGGCACCVDCGLLCFTLCFVMYCYVCLLCWRGLGLIVLGFSLLCVRWL